MARKGNPAGDRGARQLDLEGVAAGFGGLERGVLFLAVQLRIHVAAAGEHQPVDPRQDVLDLFGAGDDFNRFAAGAADRFHVVGHTPVLGDGDQGHGVSASYIRAGTATPIRSSTRVNCCR